MIEGVLRVVVNSSKSLVECAEELKIVDSELLFDVFKQERPYLLVVVLEFMEELAHSI